MLTKDQEKKLREYAEHMRHYGGDVWCFGEGLIKILDGDLSWSDPCYRTITKEKVL